MLHPVVIIAIVLAIVLIFAKFKLQYALNQQLATLTPEHQSAWFLHRKPSRKLLGLFFAAAMVVVLVLYFVIPPSVVGGATAYLVFLGAVLLFSWVDRHRLLSLLRAEDFPEPFQRANTRTKNLEVGVLTVLMISMTVFFIRAAQ